MALQRIGEDWAFGTEGVAAEGIVEVTDFEASREFGTQVEGIGADGEIGAFLYGKEINNLAVEGYAEALEVPAIGGEMEVAGITGTVMRCSIRGSNQDFVKARSEGKGYPALQ